VNQNPDLCAFQRVERAENALAEIAMTCVEIQHAIGKIPAQENANAGRRSACNRVLAQGSFGSAAGWA